MNPEHAPPGSTQLHEPDPVHVIAEEVFASLVDGESGHLALWSGPPPAVDQEVFAWVDVHGAIHSRVLLSTEQATAQHLTRALLGMGLEEPVSDVDLADALGEVANVVGGNVKALVPQTGAMTLPTVAREHPPAERTDLLRRVALSWRGRLLTVSVWGLPHEEPEPRTAPAEGGG